MSEYATGGCVVMDDPSYVNNIDYSMYEAMYYLMFIKEF